jgi:ribosomal peptide maturation radical SAM protein 1
VVSKFNVALVQPPFLGYYIPSLPLTMLRGALNARFRDDVETRIVYANLEFARYFGLDAYEEICLSGKYFYSGFGEWFFRQVAFADLPDNTDDYFNRFYPTRCDHTDRFRTLVREKRAGLDRLLDRIVDEYRLAESDVVGFNSTFQENLVSFALARKVKERNPHVVTIMGGSNCESPAGEEIIRHVDDIDFVFSGPGLLSLSQFVEAHLNQRLDDRHRIDGVFSRLNCGLTDPKNPTSRFLTVRPIAQDLDINEPYTLDYDSYFDDLDRTFPDYDVTSVIPFQTSSGCWWGEKSHCTFCGLNGKTMAFRSMKAARVIQTIESLYKYKNRAQVLLWTDSIMDPAYTTDVFPHLKPPPEMVIYNQVKVPLSEEDVRSMADARVLYTTPGFEAFSTSSLKLMAKGVSAFANLEVMKYCTMYGVHPLWGLLVGSPGETEAVYAKYVNDLPLFTHFPAPIGVFTVKFHRYSPYWREPDRHGVRLEPDDYYALTYPFDAATLAQLAYEFQDVNLSDYKIAVAKWFARVREQIDAWKARWRDGRPAPQLYLKGEGDDATVYDSRKGEPREVRIGALGREVLLALEKSKRLDTIASEFSHVAGFDAAREVAALRANGFVFEEGDRVLSLVLSRPPTLMPGWEYSYIQGRRVKRDAGATNALERCAIGSATDDVDAATRVPDADAAEVGASISGHPGRPVPVHVLELKVR